MGLKDDGGDWTTIVNPGSIMMRMLVITPHEKEAANKVVEYASKPENYYIPDVNVPPPGNKREHCLQICDFRSVLSVTKLHGKLYRHLSISVPSEVYPIKKFANPVAVWTLAELFGFTGYEHGVNPADDWLIHVNDQEHCIVLAQELA